MSLPLRRPLAGRRSYDTLWQIFVYFTEAGAFVFGSGLAIVPFLYGGVVKEYRLAQRSAVPRRRGRRA